MDSPCLIDLYVPFEAGHADEILSASQQARLDGVVVAAGSAEEMAAIAEVASSARPCMLVGRAVCGDGWRLIVLLPACYDASSYEDVAAHLEPEAVERAARSLGGVALPVCPRQSDDGSVSREPTSFSPDCKAGHVVLVSAGSLLAADLEAEDVGLAGRRLLGGCGPFGRLDDVGRFATLLDADLEDGDSILAALAEGQGIAVERGLVPRAQPSGDGPPGKKRKRRRRGPRGDRAGDPGGEST